LLVNLFLGLLDSGITQKILIQFSLQNSVERLHMSCGRNC